MLHRASNMRQGPHSILLPCRGEMRTLYKADVDGNGRRWQNETHRHYDFCLNFESIPADGVHLVMTLEVAGGGPLEERLLRASLLLSNSVELKNLQDVQHRWAVNRSDQMQVVVLRFSSDGYLPLSGVPSSSQFTVRITANAELGPSALALRVTPLYYALPPPPDSFQPQSAHLIMFEHAPTPIQLCVDASGRFWSTAVYGLREDSTWRPFHKGYSTIRPPHKTQQQPRRHHHPQQPFDQTHNKPPAPQGEYASFGWTPPPQPPNNNAAQIVSLLKPFLLKPAAAAPGTPEDEYDPTRP